MSKLTQLTQMTQGSLGNTRTKLRGRKWCFTLNNFTEEEEKKLTQKHSENCEIIWQVEMGEKKTEHIQGFIKFKNPRTFKSIKKIMGDRYHIEKCKGSDKQNIKYCSKEDTRVRGPYGNINWEDYEEMTMDKFIREERDKLHDEHCVRIEKILAMTDDEVIKYNEENGWWYI